jgi:hypothetical protein
MKLLTEDFLVESKIEGKNTFIEGIFMQSKVKNRNGRVYPEQILDTEANRYVTEYVNKGRAVGELNHPATPSINLDRVSHKITGLIKDGYNWVGKAQVIDTPMGNVVKGLLNAGVMIGVSTRGLGSLRTVNGIQEVQNDFRLSAIDIVSDPSAPDAYVDAINESTSWVYCEDGKCFIRQDLVEEHKKQTKKKLSTTKKIQMFEEFINSI